MRKLTIPLALTLILTLLSVSVLASEQQRLLEEMTTPQSYRWVFLVAADGTAYLFDKETGNVRSHLDYNKAKWECLVTPEDVKNKANDTRGTRIKGRLKKEK